MPENKKMSRYGYTVILCVVCQLSIDRRSVACFEMYRGFRSIKTVVINVLIIGCG